MNQTDLKALTESVRVIVREVGHFIKTELGKVQLQDIESKELNSLVSYVDKEAEKMLVEELSTLLPQASFLTEEDTVSNERTQYTWIVDPLDGTTNFLYQLPIFSVSVALEIEGQIDLGIVHAIMQQEDFYAWKGGGAFLNGKPVHVSDKVSLSESLIATGFPYDVSLRKGRLINIFGDLIAQCRDIRRYGSAAMDLAYVSCGRLDGYYEKNLNPWDVCAGALLVQEAGGQISGFDHDEEWKEGTSILAAGPKTFHAMQEIIQKH